LVVSNIGSSGNGVFYFDLGVKRECNNEKKDY
jgi:hypothetical protein